MLLNKSTSDANWLVNLDKIEDSTRKNYFSVLPQEDALVEEFSEAFVLNRPKGHVGGDGFWLHKHGASLHQNREAISSNVWVMHLTLLD